MAKFQPIIKWTGSKRSQSENIVALMPKEINTYYEPFIGGGSVLRQLLESNIKVNKYIVGDKCKVLIDLWNIIKANPNELLNKYSEMWLILKDRRVDYYLEIRKLFNQTKDPYLFFFLTRTSANGLVRFNSKGEFNSAFNHKRDGIQPDRLKPILLEWSSKIQNVEFVNCDYRELTKNATEDDFIYLDPPYEDTDTMYEGKFLSNEFYTYLNEINLKNIKWITSYNGFANTESIKRNFVSSDLYKRHEYLKSGISGFRKLTNTFTDVYESLYLNF